MSRSAHHRTARDRGRAEDRGTAEDGGTARDRGRDRERAEEASRRPAAPDDGAVVPAGGTAVPGDDQEPGAGGDGGERQVWCDTCEAMVPVGDLDEDDCCPTCGEPVGPRRVPWKFRLMIAATVVYLGYRAFQGIEWVVHHA